MAERLATWDDEREAERGREAFYTDRCVFFLPPRAGLAFPCSSRTFQSLQGTLACTAPSDTLAGAGGGRARPGPRGAAARGAQRPVRVLPRPARRPARVLAPDPRTRRRRTRRERVVDPRARARGRQAQLQRGAQTCGARGAQGPPDGRHARGRGRVDAQEARAHPARVLGRRRRETEAVAW